MALALALGLGKGARSVVVGRWVLFTVAKRVTDVNARAGFLCVDDGGVMRVVDFLLVLVVVVVLVLVEKGKWLVAREREARMTPAAAGTGTVLVDPDGARSGES